MRSTTSPLLAPMALLLLLLLLYAALSAAVPLNCPIQGPVFPKPTSLSAWPTMQEAFRNVTAQLASTGAASPDLSFSVELWSVGDAGGRSAFEYHHTAANLASLADSPGVRAVDRDAVYRIGSLTKIFTVYTWLVEAGMEHWGAPVTRFVPELTAIAAARREEARRDPIMVTDWDEITVGALAGQLAGLVRDYAQMGELTQQYDASTLSVLGFPPIPRENVPPCGPYILCNRTQFFEGMRRLPPQYAPYQATVYSDTAFQILGYALETITGRPYGDMLRDSVLAPLGLNRTYLYKPDDSVGVIPANRSNVGSTGWAYGIGESAPTGNMYASSSDLSRLGRAILSSRLTSPTLTARWLKPASMTSEFNAGVGYPWGVRRINLGRPPFFKRVTDSFNKAGRIGSYAALLSLLPDWDAGLVVMLSGNSIVGNPTFNWADTLGGVLLPALERTAREQADAAYSGRYVASGGVNSSLEIRTGPDRPGLGVFRWVSNGTDMQGYALLLQNSAVPTTPSIRLYPTGLETRLPDGGRRVAFKAVFEDLTNTPPTNEMFTTDCGTWVSATSVVYGDLPLEQFVFNLDAGGKVLSVEPVALRIQLAKTTGPL